MEPRSFRDFVGAADGAVERERRRQHRDTSEETKSVRFLLKHYGLLGHTNQLLLDHRDRTGTSRLTLADFVRTFNFPVWPSARRLLDLSEITATLLLRETATGGPTRRHPLVLAYQDALEAAEGTGLPGVLLFSWPSLGLMAVHGLLDLRRQFGTVLVRRWPGLEYCLESATSFLGALNWRPHGHGDQ